MSGSGLHPPDYEPFDPVTTVIEPGVTLVEASAGTGKTYSLTTLAVRLLLDESVDVERLDEILLVTFTEKATAELRGRLRERLVQTLEAIDGGPEGGDRDPTLSALLEHCGVGDDATRQRARGRLRLALSSFDEVRVQTLHAFCGQLLRESALEAGEPFEAEFVEVATELEAQAVEDAWRQIHGDAPAWWAQLLRSTKYTLEAAHKDFRALRNHRSLPFLDEPEALEQQRVALEQCLDRALALAQNCDRDELRARVRSVKRWKNSYENEGVDQRVEAALADGVEIDGRWIDLFSPRGWIRHAYATSTKSLWPWFSETELGRALAEWAKLCEAVEESLPVAVLRAACARYDEIKARDHLLDFDDLITRVHERLVDSKTAGPLLQRVRSRLKVGLIDEFQDTDTKQWDIFRTLFEGRRLVLVGDPKQAIYGFRGADVRAYLSAAAASRTKTTLAQNWRSDPRLVGAVSHLFGRFEPAFAVDEIRFPKTSGALKEEDVALVGDDRPPLLFDVLGEDFGASDRTAIDAEILRRLARRVQGLLASELRLGVGGRRLDAGDLAVLVRTGQQGKDVVAALREAGVAAVLGQLGDIYESDEMRDLEIVLDAALHPRSAGRRQRAAATRLFGAKLSEVVDAHQPKDDDADAKATQWASTLLAMHDEWKQRGLVAAIGTLLVQRDVRRRLLELRDGERRWTNLEHAIEILDRDATDHQLDAAALVRWIGRQRDHVGDDDRRQLRLERDARAVQVLTMHKCKGLQFEVVLCPFLMGAVRQPQKGQLQILRGATPSDSAWWRVPSVGQDAPPEVHALAMQVELEQLAEDLRLLYVAVTRARRRCLVWTGATGKDAARSALSFLLFGRDREDGESLAEWWQDIQSRAKRGWQNPIAAIDELCAGSDGRWGTVEELDVDASTSAAEVVDEDLAAAVFPEGRRLQRERVVSFTSWTRDAPRLRAQDHLDPDELPLGIPAVEATPDGLFAFARGARAGLCLHELLECVDWSACASEDHRASIEAILTRYGLESASAHRADIDPVAVTEKMLADVAALALPDSKASFAALSVRERRAEWPFDAALGREDRVAPRELAAVFRQHGRGDWVEGFADRLAQLSPARIRGVLTGFVDLVFRDGERWWVLDWKSNHLGDRPEDYGPDALLRSMLEHEYHLQYHLYLVALHRHLRRCVPDYDPQQHLGGAVYVYLRGIGDAERGCYVDRPSAALVVALDRCLDGAQQEAWA